VKFTQYQIIAAALGSLNREDLVSVSQAIVGEIRRREAQRAEGNRLSDEDLVSLVQSAGRLEARLRQVQRES
jgi:hypothetical protein